jgi:hypothetical protein
MSHRRTSFRQSTIFIIASLLTTFSAATASAQSVQRIDPQRDLTVNGSSIRSIPPGVRPPKIDWSIHSLKIEQGVFVKAEIRNLSKTSSPAPQVRLTAFRQLAATQSAPNSKGDTTGSGGNMSAIIADMQPAGASAGDVLSVPPYAIPKDFLECSEITADVDFKRAFPDTNGSNNKVTIKTKCGATPATMHQSALRPIL